MEAHLWPHAGLALALTTATLAAASGGAVTESEAIRLFLETTPRARAAPLIAESVAAERREGAPAPNPAVAFQIEEAAGVRDSFATVHQELPITGRLRLVRESARAASRVAGLAAEQDLLDDAYALKASFYEVLYHQEAHDLLWAGMEELDRLVEALRRREAEGEGSGYDLLRAEQEAAAVAMEAMETEARVRVARSRFGSFFDPDRRMDEAWLKGDFGVSDSMPDAGEAVEQAFRGRADLRALAVEADSLALARRAALRRRLPEPTLGAGWKRTEASGLSDSGFVASLTIPLPLFDRGQFAAARAGADRLRSALELEILRREVRAGIQAALHRERMARQAAQAYGADIERRAAELRRIARLAYEEGESGILDLLDAHRASLAMELRALALRFETKSAEIDRNRAIGIEVTP